MVQECLYGFLVAANSYPVQHTLCHVRVDGAGARTNRKHLLNK